MRWEGGCLRVLDPSPLARLGCLHGTPNDLEASLEARWWSLAQETERALFRAGQVAPKAYVALTPWRIEAELERENTRVLVWFSAQGDRAVVMGLGGRCRTLQGGVQSVAVGPSWDDELGREVRRLRASWGGELKVPA